MSIAGGLPLSGRTALVTGAGNGLGAAIARALHRSGARVLLAGRRLQPLEDVAVELDAAGPAAHTGCVQVDVADPASVDRLAPFLDGEDVDVLVNNAGVAGPVAPLWDIDPVEWDEVFAVNVRGVYLMSRLLIPRMLARGSGDIINIASVTGKRPLARRTPYAASKTAVIGLTTTLAHELGPIGVNVNSLSPGPVQGPRMARNFALEATRTGMTAENVEYEFVSRAALQRMVTEDEVGGAVVAMLQMGGLCGADIDLSAGMIGR